MRHVQIVVYGFRCLLVGGAISAFSNRFLLADACEREGTEWPDDFFKFTDLRCLGEFLVQISLAWGHEKEGSGSSRAKGRGADLRAGGGAEDRPVHARGVEVDRERMVVHN